jgi:RES domain-containing protein
VEILVHVPAGVLPAFTAVSIEFDDSWVEILGAARLPPDWASYPPPVSTQVIGNEWVSTARSAALRVPSVIVPTEHNYLLNPGHVDFARARIGTPMPFPFDPRLLSR